MIDERLKVDSFVANNSFNTFHYAFCLSATRKEGGIKEMVEKVTEGFSTPFTCLSHYVPAYITKCKGLALESFPLRLQNNTVTYDVLGINKATYNAFLHGKESSVRASLKQ